MVQISLDLTNKKTFFIGSGIFILFMFLHITNMLASINISGLDILGYYGLCIFAALLFWIPYQFNQFA